MGLCINGLSNCQTVKCVLILCLQALSLYSSQTCGHCLSLSPLTLFFLGFLYKWTAIFSSFQVALNTTECQKWLWKISGLKINISKSECMSVGKSCVCKGEFCGINGVCLIKCFRVYLTYDYEEFVQVNYKKRLKIRKHNQLVERKRFNPIW